MKLRQIEMFRAIMATGSFTAAAELLHISQPGISRAARHLEVQLGVTLFERTHGRIRPTAEAKALHREVERSYRGVKSIEDFANRLKFGPNAVLRVVASANVALQLVPNAIAVLSSRDLDASFTLEVLRGPLMLEALLQERADIGITAVQLEHPLLESIELGRWDVVCVYPVGHPLAKKQSLTAQDVARYNLIAFESDLPQGEIANDWLGSTATRCVARVRSGQTACVLAASGAGVAFSDSLTARYFEVHGLAWRPLPNTRSFVMHATWSENAPLSQFGKDFCRELIDQAQALPAARKRGENAAGRRVAD